MRNISSTISTFGIQIIRQGVLLITGREAFRTLGAISSRALPWFASPQVGDVLWRVVSCMTAKRMACCFALAKQQGRHPRVTGHRSVG